MAKIAELGKTDVLALERGLQRAIHGAPSLEAAAQRYAQMVYDALSDSIVLLRLFATVPYSQLPDANQAFVRTVIESAGGGVAITDDTLVLSLLGTAGVEPAWCDRRKSINHVGVPLVSQDFVAEIPMISRMLKQLGVELDWLDRKDTAIVGRTFGVQSGVFYVADAETAVDSQGRKIIAAQEFVADYAIKTVFGVGGGYVGTPVYVSIIGFCRDTVEQDRVEGLRSHVARFKAETDGLVKHGRIFSTSVQP